MLYKLETEHGSIQIEKAVIRKIVVECVGLFEGKVRLANSKGQPAGIVSKLGGMDDSNLIVITKSAGGIDIRMNIVIRFGSSINKVTEQLISDIREKTLQFAGIEVGSVMVVITGMMAKRLVRRNITVKG